MYTIDPKMSYSGYRIAFFENKMIINMYQKYVNTCTTAYSSTVKIYTTIDFILTCMLNISSHDIMDRVRTLKLFIFKPDHSI